MKRTWIVLVKVRYKIIPEVILSLILMIAIGRCKSIMEVVFQSWGSQCKNKCLIELLAWQRCLSLWLDKDDV